MRYLQDLSRRVEVGRVHDRIVPWEAHINFVVIWIINICLVLNQRKKGSRRWEM